MQVIMRGCFLSFSVGTTLGCGLCMRKYVCSACQGLSKGSWYAHAMLADFVKSKGQYENTSLNRKGKKNIHGFQWAKDGKIFKNSLHCKFVRSRFVVSRFDCG